MRACAVGFLSNDTNERACMPLIELHTNFVVVAVAAAEAEPQTPDHHTMQYFLFHSRTERYH